VHLRIPWRQSLDRPRVLLAEVSRAMLATEIALLSPEFDVVGTAADGAALVSEACRLCPDVIVTIFDMPILSGIDAMRKLQTSGCTARFIFFTLHPERVSRGMHGSGSVGIRAQVQHETPFGSRDKSGARRSVLRFPIRPCFLKGP
jgi:CheY-like chemotaxis protein